MIKGFYLHPPTQNVAWCPGQVHIGRRWIYLAGILWVYLAVGDRDCTHLCISIWSWIWSGLRPSRIQNPSFSIHASDLRPKGDETKQVSDKRHSVGSQASGATIQSGAANKTARQTREIPFESLEPGASPLWPGVQSPVTRELCSRNSAASLAAQSLQDWSSCQALWKGTTASCRDAIAVNSLLNGVFEEVGRCVARR